MNIRVMQPKNIQHQLIGRRGFLLQSMGLGLATLLSQIVPAKSQTSALMKSIPSTGETIPVIGMGTWISFNVGNNLKARNHCSKILYTFFKMGGTLVDSSPMYGSSEEVLGYALRQLGIEKDTLFSATKVWTPSEEKGKQQIQNSFDLWGIKQFDLFQIHNLLSWEKHLKTLQEMKRLGLIRYIGITTSHGRRHQELEQIIKSQSIDFVQLTYNLLDREVENRLLPAAQDNGIAVIANRPFQGGELFPQFEHKPLPEWSKEFDCHNWAQFFLKFIVSHPAVTCAIPATTKIDHMVENMGALYGRLPDAKLRAKMIAYGQSV